MESKKLTILKNSLEKKENVLNQKIDNHFSTVKQANGQPLNDKKNGFKTLNKWEQQNESIRNQFKEIEKTKTAIKKEEFKIKNCERVLKDLPEQIIKLLENGTLTQWRKFPNRFFVKDGGQGRIIWEQKTKKLLCSFVPAVGTSERENFANCFNQLKSDLLNSQQ